MELHGQRAQQEAMEQLLKAVGDSLEQINQMHKKYSQAKGAAQALSTSVPDVHCVYFQNSF